METLIKSKKLKIISVITIVFLILTSYFYSIYAYSLDEIAVIARTDVQKFFSIPASEILGKRNNGRINPNYDKNTLCVEHYVKSSIYQEKYWEIASKVVDINFDGANTVKITNIDGRNKSLTSNNTSKEALKYFNAIAYATAHAKGGDEAQFKGPYGDAVAALCNADILNQYLELNGTNGENAFYSDEGRVKKEEALKFGEKVANYVDSTLTASKDTDPTSDVKGDNTYLGPFKYTSSKSGEKVSFNNIEIIGKDENGKDSINIKVDPSKNLYSFNGVKYEHIANGSIEQNKPFYIMVDKKIDVAPKIKVKINIDGPAYYKSRLVFFQMYDEQTFTLFSIGNGADTNTGKSLEYEFENNRGNLEIVKKGYRYGQEVNKVANMGFRVYYKDGNNKQYLKITTDTKMQDGKYVGEVDIKKQEATTKAEEATTIYTNSSGIMRLNGIDTRNKYYLEEISKDTDFSKNVIAVLDEEGKNIWKDGEIGPITVKKKSEAKQTKIVIYDDIKRGNLEINKQDYDTGKSLDNVEFKINAGGKWITAQTVADGEYKLLLPSEDADFASKNFTTDESKATTFKTDKNGKISIKNVDKGTYTLVETSNSHYGYQEKIIAGATVNGKDVDPLKINKNKVTINVEGNDDNTTSTAVIIKDEKQTGELTILKKDKDTEKPLKGIEFVIQRYNAKTEKFEYIQVSKNDDNNWEKTVTGEFHIGNMKTTEEQKDATTFITNDEGAIKLSDIYVGKYKIIETSANYGYTPSGKKTEIDPEYVYWVDSQGKEHLLKDEEIIVNVSRKAIGLEGFLFIGDSITYGLGVSDSIQGATFRGTSGSTIDDWLNDKQAYGKATYSSLPENSDNIKALCVMLGTNQVNLDENKTVDDMRNLLAKLHKDYSNKTIYVQKLLPIKGENKETYNNKIKQICDGLDYATFIDSTNGVKLQDGVHPTMEGYKKLAENTMKLVSGNESDSKDVTLLIKNKMKYLNISGKVWEDLRLNKDGSFENAFKDIYLNYGDGNEPLVEGITVRLKDKSGKEINTAITDKNGHYEFKDVLIKDLAEYYVEFEYDGFTYTSVLPMANVDVNEYNKISKTKIESASEVNSKAKEVVEQRKKLNSAFAEITNHDDNDRSKGYSRDSKGETTGTLTYKNDEDNFKSIFEGTTYNNETYKGINLTANTELTGYSLNKEYTEKRYIIREDGSYEIPNVNLGIVKREQPNISIRNDLSRVEVQVNGFGATYTSDLSGNKYGTWSEADRDFDDPNIGVRFGNYSGTYKREVYPSDIQFSKEQTEDAKKLKVYAVYKVTIENNSSSNADTNRLNVSVPEIINYHDSNYEIVKDGTDFPGTPGLTGIKMISLNGQESTNTLKHDKDTSVITDADGTKYVAERITIGNLGDAPKIEAGNSLELEITYQVSDEEVITKLNGGDKTLKNVVEINAYSTYYSSQNEGCESGEVYAGIDTNSAPGNATPGNVTTYEDDTDEAPGFILTAKGVRQLEGTVFEDETKLKDNERLGDGILSDTENTRVKNAKVELMKFNNDGTLEHAKYYPDATIDDEGSKPNPEETNGTDAPIYTSDRGYYLFKGLEPDEGYVVKYTYGTYENGENEIVSKFVDASGNELDFTVQNYKSTIISADYVKQAFEEDKDRAWYKHNKNSVIKYSEAKDDWNSRQEIDNELIELTGNSNPTIKNIFANTPKFDISVDLDTLTTDAEPGQLLFIHKIKDVNLGITERPRQSAELDKHISYIKVTLSNKQVLTEGKVDIKKGETPKYVAIIPGEGITITVDNELLYGSQIELGYILSLTNTSEEDYVSKSYYYYGDKGTGDGQVKFTSASLIDYVDKEMVLKEGQTGEDGKWKVLEDLSYGLNTEYLPIIRGGTQEEKEALVNKLKENFRTLVVADKLISEEEPIAPGETKTADIFVEKVVGNNTDELLYENNGEVARIKKSGGSALQTELGNYEDILADPDVQVVTTDEEAVKLTAQGAEKVYVLQTDETKAETVAVIPPTGSTDNTVTYAIIGAIGLVVLGAGIYGTKRFLKKETN